MDSSRIGKRKIADLTRAKHVSQSAVAAILLDIKRHGLPSAFSRGSQYRSRRAGATEATPYGPVVTSVRLQLMDGGEAELHVQHPMAMLWLMCRQSKGFSKLVRWALAKHPSTAERPWRIVLYNDEVGIVKLKRDSRKAEAVYWSFLEFGPTALADEDCWFAVCAPRSETIQLTGANTSALINAIWPVFFWQRWT